VQIEQPGGWATKKPDGGNPASVGRLAGGEETSAQSAETGWTVFVVAASVGTRRGFRLSINWIAIAMLL